MRIFPPKVLPSQGERESIFSSNTPSAFIHSSCPPWSPALSFSLEFREHWLLAYAVLHMKIYAADGGYRVLSLRVLALSPTLPCFPLSLPTSLSLSLALFSLRVIHLN